MPCPDLDFIAAATEKMLQALEAQPKSAGCTYEVKCTSHRHDLTVALTVHRVAAAEVAGKRWWMWLHERYPELVTCVVAVLAFFSFAFAASLFCRFILFLML